MTDQGFITVKTNDEKIIKIEKERLKRFVTLKNMCDDLGGMANENFMVDCKSQDVVFLLEFIKEYDLMPIDARSLLEQKNKEQIFSIYQAANYLQVEEALFECGQILYDQICLMNDEQIKDFFTEEPRDNSYYENMKSPNYLCDKVF